MKATREAACQLALASLASLWVLSAFRGVAPHYSGDSTVWLESAYGADLWGLLLGKRPLLVPGVHRLFGFDDEAVVWFQACVQLLAATAFASQLAAFWSSARSRLFVYSASLLWLILDANDWAFSVRSESLSHSFLLFFEAALLGFLRGSSATAAWPRWTWLGAVVLAALGLAGTRDAAAYQLAAAALFVPCAGYLIRKSRRGFGPDFVLAGLLLTVAVGASRLTEHSPRYRVPLTNVVLQRVLTSPRARDYFKHELGLPVSPALLARKGKNAHSDNWLVLQDPQFASYTAWLDQHGPSAYRRYLSSHLPSTVAHAFPWFSRYVQADYRAYLTQPRSLGLRTLRAGTHAVNPLVAFPKLSWALLLAAGLWACRAEQPGRRLLGALLAFICASTALLTYVCYHGDSVEVARHGASVAPSMRVAAALAVALGMSTWLLRSSSRSAGASAAPTTAHAAATALATALVIAFLGLLFLGSRVRPNLAPQSALRTNLTHQPLSALVDGDLDAAPFCLERRGDWLELEAKFRSKGSRVSILRGTGGPIAGSYSVSITSKNGVRSWAVKRGQRATVLEDLRAVSKIRIESRSSQLCIAELRLY